jgi:hypothetical protein
MEAKIMNRRQMIASLFIAPIAPKLAEKIAPKPNYFALIKLQIKKSMDVMRRQLDKYVFSLNSKN